MKKYILPIVLFISLFVSSCESLVGPKNATTPAPQVYKSRLATILDSLRYKCDFPALAGAIVTDTGVIEAYAVGSRRYGGPANVTNDDRFHIGSCTKSMTAVLIGTLVDKGLVRWNTTLPEIFPEYKTIMRDEYKNVTVSDILSHGAGFMRDPNLKVQSISSRDKRSEIVAWALTQAPVKGRGNYLYSNLGYVIAGAITEKITNRPYEEIIMENVLLPLGITTAGIGVCGTEGQEDQPLQHTANHAPIKATPNSSLDAYYNPAGGLYMSVGDWGKYVHWVITVEAGRHQNLLTDETARTITAPHVSAGVGVSYSFGWSVSNQDWAGGKSLQHSGSTGFNYSTVCLSSNRHFGIILMTNQGPVGEDWPLGPAFYRLLDYYIKGN